MKNTILLLLACGVTGCVAPIEVGRRDFQEFCVACHGDTGAGNGWAAEHLEKRPADLTTISKRNNGEFPTIAVMGTIDGYSRRLHGNMTMPEFGPMLQAGDLVLLETGPGVFTPTPERLIALASYIETLQK